MVKRGKERVSYSLRQEGNLQESRMEKYGIKGLLSGFPSIRVGKWELREFWCDAQS